MVTDPTREALRLAAAALLAADEVIGWAYAGAEMLPAKVIAAGERVQHALVIIRAIDAGLLP